MEGSEKAAINTLKSAFGNIDLISLKPQEFKSRLVAYGASLECDYKTLNNIISELIAARVKTVPRSIDDKSQYLSEVLNEINDIKAENQANQLIDEEERLKKKQDKRREKKKRRNDKKKNQKNQDIVNCLGEMSISARQQHGSTSSLDVVESNKARSRTDEIDQDVSEDEDENSDDNWREDFKENRPNEMLDSVPRAINSTTASGYTFGRQGNFRAEMGQFEEAIKCYTNAIQLLPNDSKLYGNRSCCYEKLEKYDKALDDANKAIELDQSLHMNYFRKGLALSGLKRYREAEKAFKDVLKLDPQCCFPVRELMLLRKAELMDMGFDENKAYAAACTYKTVQEASNGILENKVPDDPLDDVYMSDEDEVDDDSYFEVPRPIVSKEPVEEPPAPQITTHFSRPTDVSVWVGNILTTIDNVELHRLFSKYGEVKSITVLREKIKDDCHCAFIDFKESSSVSKAITALHGYKLSGKSLILRIPNKPSSGDGESVSKPKEDNRPPRMKILPVNGECFYWRTFGMCRNGSNCTYKHIPEHRSVDRK